MFLALVLSTVLSAETDSMTSAVVAPPAAASIPASSPKSIDLDSLWGGSVWSAAFQFHSAPIQAGGVVDLEKEFLDNVALQNYEFELQVWKSLSSKLDVGLGYGHSWLLEFGGIRTSDVPGFGLAVSSDALVARCRYWSKRQRKWELGPQFGLGYTFGTLNRLSVVDDPSISSSKVGLSEWDLVQAQRSIDVSGLRVEAGLAMEILVHPRFTVGGVLLLTINAWNGDDPANYTNSKLKDAGFGNTTLGPQFHAAYRF